MSAVDIFLVIVSMAGGLALFMFGMNIMSKSLSSLTGGALDQTDRAVSENDSESFDEAMKKLRVHELFRDKYDMLRIGEDEEGHIIDLAE